MTDRQLNALRDARARIDRLIAAWDEVQHWIDFKDTNHIAGTDYDRSGGSSSGEIRDLSIRVLRPNPGKLDRKQLRNAVDRIIGGSIDADDVRVRNLTAKNERGFTGDNDAMWCRGHLAAGSREPRSTGDECRPCADFRRGVGRRPTKDEIDQRTRTGRWPRSANLTA
jgi:hypothetical protein